MPPTIVVIAPGMMGSAVGRRLKETGAQVRTSLVGRSASSAERAARAGLEAIEDDRKLLEGARFVLSIVPPGQAVAFAERMAPILASRTSKPVFVDCNAVNPRTVTKIAKLIEPTGSSFVDAGIIGGPPREGYDGPRFYASGRAAASFAALNDYGLDVRPLDDKVGTASALKLSYASLTKGLTALAAVMILGAGRAGVAAPLRRELKDSQAALLAWIDRQMPTMYSKAYRWIAEMEEIAGYLEADPAGETMFDGAARLYAQVADAAGADGEVVATLEAFVKDRA